MMKHREQPIFKNFWLWMFLCNKLKCYLDYNVVGIYQFFFVENAL